MRAGLLEKSGGSRGGVQAQPPRGQPPRGGLGWGGAAPFANVLAFSVVLYIVVIVVVFLLCRNSLFELVFDCMRAGL